MKTLQEALSVFRYGFNEMGDSFQCQSVPSETKKRSILLNAMERLTTQPSAITADSNIQMKVISSNELPRVVKYVLEGRLSSTDVHAIRIEDPDFESIAVDGPDAECAITLHNFALSYLGMSGVSRTMAKADQMREGAIRLNAAARTVVENGQERTMENIRCESLLLIEVLLLDFSRQYNQRSRLHDDRLAVLKRLLTSQGSEVFHSSMTLRAAAAA